MARQTFFAVTLRKGKQAGHQLAESTRTKQKLNSVFSCRFNGPRQCCQQNLFFKTKTMLSRPRPRLKTAVIRPRPRSFFQDQDQDQDFLLKKKTSCQKKKLFGERTRSSKLCYKNVFKLCGLRQFFTLLSIKIAVLNC
jgi:hypothetical protein